MLPPCVVIALLTSARCPAAPPTTGPAGAARAATARPTRRTSPTQLERHRERPLEGRRSPARATPRRSSWGDRIFLTTAVGDGAEARAAVPRPARRQDALGAGRAVARRSSSKHDLNSYASATPATDGKHVWVSFLQQPTILLACYDLDGNEVWRKSPGRVPLDPRLLLARRCCTRTWSSSTATRTPTRGSSRSTRPPARSAGGPTGRTRRGRTARRSSSSVDGKTQMVLSGSKSVASYDPDTGKQHLGDRRPDRAVRRQRSSTRRACSSSPAASRDLHILGIDPRGSGNVHEDPHQLARPPQGVSYVPSPVAHDQLVLHRLRQRHRELLRREDGQGEWKERLGRRHSAVGRRTPAGTSTSSTTTARRSSSRRRRSSSWSARTRWARRASRRRPSRAGRSSSARRTTCGASASRRRPRRRGEDGSNREGHEGARSGA